VGDQPRSGEAPDRHTDREHRAGQGGSGRVEHAEHGSVRGNIVATAGDTFAGSTIQPIVLTVPVGAGELRAGRSIATSSATTLATDAGSWRQIGRTGLPMIWPIFRDKTTDAAATPTRHTRPTTRRTTAQPSPSWSPRVARRRGTTDRPDARATHVVDRIVPDLLAYVVGSPARPASTGCAASYVGIATVAAADAAVAMSDTDRR
jgi:hypothetical protein